MLNQPKSDYISHFPIDFETNKIFFGAKSKCNYHPNLVWINKFKRIFPVRNDTFQLVNAILVNWHMSILYSYKDSLIVLSLLFLQG